MAGVVVRIQHTSMQYSDSAQQHLHDAKAVFDRAVARKIWACTGTESGAGKNHDLRDALVRAAQEHDFFILAHGQGEWVALNRRYLSGIVSGFAGPFIEAQGGRGGHAARGVTWASGVAEAKLGRITVGSCHYLTDRSERAQGESNQALIRGIAQWGREAGKGSGVAFLGGDVNTNDRSQDVFGGRPFTTIADELRTWPATHGRSIIDMVASYDHDGRVKALRYQVLNDKEFMLYSDHNLLHAVYEITERV